MKVWRKQTVRYRLDGKTVPKETPDAQRETIRSNRFYGTLRASNGKRKQIPLTEDRTSSETLLRRLQTQEDADKANGVDRYTKERRRPLSEHLADYETHLRSKGNTDDHVSLAMLRIRSLLNATTTTTLGDIDASRLASTLADWRRRGRQTKRMGRTGKRETISVKTSNHYARAIKGFTRWLWQERRTPDDPLSPLRLLNADVDRRHQRRALTPTELQRLIKATTESGKTLRGRGWRLTPDDRAMLYLTAAYTGLRASELSSLSASSFDLEAATVSVEAAYSKRRRNDTLPLHPSLVERLRPWLGTKTDRLWAWSDTYKAVDVLRPDLERAGIPYRDAHGRVADFHALRHTFITALARSGVHPSKAKELARHSTITLTMDVYAHVATDELRDALGTLPAIE